MCWRAISYFSAAVIEHHDQDNLRKAGFTWLAVPEGGVHNGGDGLVWHSMAAGRTARSQGLTPFTISTERTFYSKPVLSGKAAPPQMTSPNGDHIFKCLRLLGTFVIRPSTASGVRYLEPVWPP